MLKLEAKDIEMLHRNVKQMEATLKTCAVAIWEPLTIEFGDGYSITLKPDGTVVGRRNSIVYKFVDPLGNCEDGAASVYAIYTRSLMFVVNLLAYRKEISQRINEVLDEELSILRAAFEQEG